MNEEKAYCVRCKKQQIMKDPKEKKSKRNTLMLQGFCAVCNTKMSKFIKKKD